VIINNAMDYRGAQLNLKKLDILFSTASRSKHLTPEFLSMQELRPEHKADFSIPSNFQVRIREAIPPIPDTSS
jgi:hypothetical protein